MTRAELREIARKTLELESLAPSEDFSPAEAFSGLARAIAGYQKNGAVPESLDVIHPLGPLEMPPAQPTVAGASLDGIYGLAGAANEHVARDGALPAALPLDEGRIGAGSLFRLFSRVYLDMDAGGPGPAYDVPACEPYPRSHEQKIVGEIEAYKTWPVHRPDLDMSRIVELTKLQLWTLKPARRR
jgi:hypothetical protein